MAQSSWRCFSLIAYRTGWEHRVASRRALAFVRHRQTRRIELALVH